MEGIVLSFVVEYSLPFLSASATVELAKELMCDPKAANKIQVSWQTALTKMQYRLAKRLEKKVIDQLIEGYFSSNIDKLQALTTAKS